MTWSSRPNNQPPRAPRSARPDHEIHRNTAGRSYQLDRGGGPARSGCPPESDSMLPGERQDKAVTDPLRRFPVPVSFFSVLTVPCEVLLLRGCARLRPARPEGFAMSTRTEQSILLVEDSPEDYEEIGRAHV